MGSPSNTTTTLLISPCTPSKSPLVPGIPKPNCATSLLVGTACISCVGLPIVPSTFLQVSVSQPIPNGSITGAHCAAETRHSTLNPNSTFGFFFNLAAFLAAISCAFDNDRRFDRTRATTSLRSHLLTRVLSCRNQVLGPHRTHTTLTQPENSVSSA